ncbi:MAG TPA: precorrin-3B C(17)-methyltransferase [Polyangiaceae bacterium]|nr:precorrin-3B C(17)-methyltransferase [Polyangiaceae bacterium]
MSGSLRIVGLGPGPLHWVTPEVSEELACAGDIVGYHAYVSRLELRADQKVHGSDNGDELARARLALELAAGGARVALVSGGDPGVFAMAAAVFEVIEAGPPSFRTLDVAVAPGVTAMLAAAARLGAPLGSDFCAINLSDNLKPRELIEKRLTLAARADFVIAIYNPASRARPALIHDAFAILRRERPADTIVAFASAVGRPDETIRIARLADADPALCDMRTLLIVGASGTRCIERPDGRCWVYSQRRAFA